MRRRKGDIGDVVRVVSAHKGIQGDTDVCQWYEAQGLEGIPNPWGGEQDADDGMPGERISLTGQQLRRQIDLPFGEHYK